MPSLSWSPTLLLAVGYLALYIIAENDRLRRGISAHIMRWPWPRGYDAVRSTSYVCANLVARVDSSFQSIRLFLRTEAPVYKILLDAPPRTRRRCRISNIRMPRFLRRRSAEARTLSVRVLDVSKSGGSYLEPLACSSFRWSICLCRGSSRQVCRIHGAS